MSDDGEHHPLDDVQKALFDEQLTPEDKYILLFNAQKMANPKVIYPILDPTKWSASHQTLMVFEVSENASMTHVERAVRMATGLNTQSTIKADIISVADAVYYSGLVWTGHSPGGISEDLLENQARQWGYNQLFIHRYVGP
jgi:hypothetical protein